MGIEHNEVFWAQIEHINENFNTSKKDNPYKKLKEISLKVGITFAALSLQANRWNIRSRQRSTTQTAFNC